MEAWRTSLIRACLIVGRSILRVAAPSTTMTTMLLKLVGLNRAQDGLGLVGRNGSTR
jgi:hypothetical protein